MALLLSCTFLRRPTSISIFKLSVHVCCRGMSLQAPPRYSARRLMRTRLTHHIGPSVFFFSPPLYVQLFSHRQTRTHTLSRSGNHGCQKQTAKQTGCFINYSSPPSALLRPVTHVCLHTCSLKAFCGCWCASVYGSMCVSTMV